MPPRPPASAARVATADYRTLSAFRYALRQFLHFSTEAARRAGLSSQQHQTLLALKGFPARQHASVGELAERLDLRPHSAVGLVDRLVKRNLVRREPDPADRRRVRVGLTAQGEALIGRLSSVHRDELRRLGPELQRLLAVLDSGGDRKTAASALTAASTAKRARARRAR
jgi:DNA-binding MarR family transcriptional regulator